MISLRMKVERNPAQNESKNSYTDWHESKNHPLQLAREEKWPDPMAICLDPDAHL